MQHGLYLGTWLLFGLAIEGPRPYNFSMRLISAALLPDTKHSRLSVAILMATLFLLYGASAQGYSVLTHEAIIDTAWDTGIRPLLLKRFPDATPDELRVAHGYAYGGCAIQDLGYYPSGSKFFSDLVHYVRSGDFIVTLLKDSTNLNEYAFAIGAMAHYAADNNGHRLAVNPSVAILYPNLKRKFGPTVTYGDNPPAHLKTEFAFDVLQVAQGRYASDAYRDYIGFEVPHDLLARAFEDTYAIDVDKIFVDFDLTIGTYRHDVSRVIPQATKIAWQIKKDDIQKDFPGITRTKFEYRLSKAEYAKQFHEKYKEPGAGAKLMALIIRFIPKIGPLRALAFRVPTPETERLFALSFRSSVQEYQELLRQLRETGRAPLMNDDFDTGTVTTPGEYPLADKTYADLLDKLSKNHFDNVSPELQATLIKYYGDPNAFLTKKYDKKKWNKTLQEVAELKAYVPQDHPEQTAPAARTGDRGDSASATQDDSSELQAETQ